MAQNPFLEHDILIRTGLAQFLVQKSPSYLRNPQRELQVCLFRRASIQQKVQTRLDSQYDYDLR